MKRCARPASVRGLSLIELVAFIVILGLVVAGLVTALSTSLRNTATPRAINQALETAQSRMELVLGQRQRLGFTAFLTSYDPCSDQPVCSAATRDACACPSGYAVTVSLAQTFSSNDANYRQVTVSVTDDSGTLAELKALVANY